MLVDDTNLLYSSRMVSTFSPVFASTGVTLLPDERSNILDEAAKVVSDPTDWFEAPNDNIGGQSPKALVDGGREAPVRNLLRTLKYIGMT